MGLTSQPVAPPTAAHRRPVRLNVGCGPSPTAGWVNYDNSWSVRLASRGLLFRLATCTPLLAEPQKHLCRVARAHGVRFGRAEELRHPDNSVDAVYSCHMLEHLDRPLARQFLAEAFRVLRPGGALRVVVPDLRKLVEQYVADGDADRFMDESLLCAERPTGALAKLRYLAIGGRHHAWMYDAGSLTALVEETGFVEVRSLPPGQTTIPDPGELDLFERADESVYVEARKP